MFFLVSAAVLHVCTHRCILSTSLAEQGTTFWVTKFVYSQIYKTVLSLLPTLPPPSGLHMIESDTVIPVFWKQGGGTYVAALCLSLTSYTTKIPTVANSWHVRPSLLDLARWHPHAPPNRPSVLLIPTLYVLPTASSDIHAFPGSGTQTASKRPVNITLHIHNHNHLFSCPRGSCQYR